MRIKTLVVAGAAIAIASPALAHHSFAMFDTDKNVTLTGIVKQFDWSNPHVWIHVLVPDDRGIGREWGFELQAIRGDMEIGWRPDSVKPGDKVSIEFHPLRDGTRGGQLVFGNTRQWPETWRTDSGVKRSNPAR